MTENVARIGKNGCAYRVLVGKSEGRKLLGECMRMWDDNV